MSVMARFSAAGASDVGRHRQNNEDRFHIDTELGVFMVIDGVGGHAAGEEAAAIAVDYITGRLRRQVGSVESRIREAITLANNEIFQRALSKPEWQGMACVLTVVIIEGDHLVIGHVGDTRLYKIHRGKIRKLTSDHSPVGEMEDAGQLSELEAMHHPRRNEVYRDVGTEPHDTHDDGFIQILTEPFEPDCALVMCSDGLSDLVTAEQVRSAVEQNAGDPASVVQDLIDAANEAGGKDNVTVIYIEGENFAPNSQRTLAGMSTVGYGQGDSEDRGFRGEQGTRFFRKVTPPRNVGPAAATARIEDAQTPQPFLLPAAARVPHERSKIGRLFLSRAALFVYGMVFAAAAIFALKLIMSWKVASVVETPPAAIEPSRLIIVDGNSYAGPKTINEALAMISGGNKQGFVILVAPGEYRERVMMIEGVALISQHPGKAIILAPLDNQSTAIVSAVGIKTGKLDGFKIGNVDRPLAVGLRIENSDVEISNVEITNAEQAAIEISGAGEAVLKANYIYDNRGVGVRISGAAAPRIIRNLISQKGEQGSKPVIEILGDAKPQFIWNTIETTGALSSLKESESEFAKRNFVIKKKPEIQQSGTNRQRPRGLIP